MDRRTFLKQLKWIGYPLLIGSATSLPLASLASQTTPIPLAVTPTPDAEKLRIRLIGTGGLGGRMVAEIAQSALLIPSDDVHIDYIAVDTDRRALDSLRLTGLHTVWIPGPHGSSGACIKPETARQLMESHAGAMPSFDGVAMTILISGFGRGAGTGLGQVIAEQSRKAGVFTAAFVTEPFSFEIGQSDLSHELKLLSRASNSTMTIAQDESDTDALMIDVMKKAERELQRRVRLLVDTIAGSSMLIGFDLEDLRTVFQGHGITASGYWSGPIADVPFDPLGLSSAAALEVIEQLPHRGSAKAALVMFSGGSGFQLEQLRCCVTTLRAWLPADLLLAYQARIDDTMDSNRFSLDVWLPNYTSL